MTSDGAMPWTHMVKVPALLAARTRPIVVMVAFSQQPSKSVTGKQIAMRHAIGGPPAGSCNVTQQLSPLSALSC